MFLDNFVFTKSHTKTSHSKIAAVKTYTCLFLSGTEKYAEVRFLLPALRRNRDCN